tara:strand:- start:25492 stop:26331 length:840 start_codon:yes stop_codon:yes gene_type:complete
MRVCLVGFVGFLLLGLSLPFLPDEGGDPSKGTFGTTVMCTVVFGAFTYLTWHTLKGLPFVDVVADDDGLWLKHTDKENGLIPWGDVASLKERATRQCLDVLNSNGERLIRIEYQLNGFEHLRSLLTNNLSKNQAESSHASDTNSNRVFGKGVGYHVFYVCAVVGFLALGWYVGSEDNVLLGYVAMPVLVLVVIGEYFLTPFKVLIDDSHITISYPHKHKKLLFANIEAIEMTDSFEKGSRIPEVHVFMYNTKKPYKLKQLGANANVLFAALDDAKNNNL